MSGSLGKTILRALEKSAGMSPQEQWGVVLQHVEVFFDVIGDAPPTNATKDIGEIQKAAAAFARRGSVVVIPTSDERIAFGSGSAVSPPAAPVGPPVRIISQGTAATDSGALPLEQWVSLDALTEEVKRVMPTEIEIDLPGFPKPIRLQRRIQPGPPAMEGVKFLRLQYTADGSADGPQVLVKTSDTAVDVETILGEIQKAAAAQYSPTERKVAPNTPYVRPPSIEEMQRMMPSTDPGPGADEACPAQYQIQTDQRNWGKYAKD